MASSAIFAAALSLAIVGDTQTWVEEGDAFAAHTEALCEHSLDGVIFTGDMVDKGKSVQWERVNAALDVLDACGLPYYLIYGNHDPKRDAAEHFAARTFQPAWQYPAKKNAVPIYAHPLSDEWTLVGVPYQGKVKGDAAAWLESLQGRLIWVHHACYKPGSDSLKKCKLPVPVEIVIVGHHKKNPRQSWTLVDGTVAVFSNVQDAPGLEEWSTLLTLDGDEACLSAWNPFTGETTYPGIGKYQKGRFKIDPPNASRCF